MDTWAEQLRLLVSRGLDEQPAAALADLLDAEADRVRALGDDRVEPLCPEAPVLGVDACRGGWVGVLLAPSGRSTVHVGATIGALVEQAREVADVAVVAIDIPIGLPDEGGRQADALARRELPGKGSSVFSTLTRAAYEADSYAAGRAANLEATAGEQSASAQAYALRTKILDVDRWLRLRPKVTVIEVHPELSFALMSGGPLLEPKKTPQGVAVRRDALAAAGFAVPAFFTLPDFAEDDLLDACAAAWTAVRHLRGESTSFPEVPEVFSDGLPAAIRA